MRALFLSTHLHLVHVWHHVRLDLVASQVPSELNVRAKRTVPKRDLGSRMSSSSRHVSVAAVVSAVVVVVW